LKGLKKVSRNSDIPIIADESMYTSEGPLYLIEHDVCHGLNIRLSSCGGFQKALEIFQQAHAKKMTVVIGAHVGETAILSYAGRNFAVICPKSRYLEGSFSRYVLKEDLVPENIAFGREGYAPTPIRSGLGIEIDETSIVARSSLYASIDS
jgi:muconate cycloisomerase